MLFQALDEDNLLIKMHNAGIVRVANAKTAEELSRLLSYDVQRLSKLLEDSIKQGYLEVTGEKRYFLSRKGIMFVSSLFT